jgi:prolyl-tRNA editing enzyme YbaK/EbsC (Cys-tRNA(Pro) deacylase)
VSTTDSELDARVLEALKHYELKFKVLACDPDLADTAAFCEHYGFALSQAANTIIVTSRKLEPTQHAVCVVLATTRLDVNKKVCQLMGIKRASFADGETTQKLTGMLIGGVTAVGISNLPIYIDAHVLKQPEVVMGGGNRSSKLLLDPRELTKLPNTQVVADLAQPKPAA